MRGQNDNLPPIKLMMAPAPVGWFGTVAAAWTGHVAGVAMMLAAVAGMTGWHREWVAAAVTPAAVAVCRAAAPVALAAGALQRAQEAAAGEMLAREPALQRALRLQGERR